MNNNLHPGSLHIVFVLSTTLCPNCPFSWVTHHIGLGSTLMTLFYLDYLCKEPVPKQDHLLRYWALFSICEFRVTPFNPQLSISNGSLCLEFCFPIGRSWEVSDYTFPLGKDISRRVTLHAPSTSTLIPPRGGDVVFPKGDLERRNRVGSAGYGIYLPAEKRQVPGAYRDRCKTVQCLLGPSS